MKISEVISYLQTIAPPPLQEDYDNAGLLTGDPEQEVTKALICLDSTEEVIDEAIKDNCNLVISHHPIVFGGLKKFTGATYVERTIIKAIKNDIAIYAAHTNLDNVNQGVNRKIADKLRLKNCIILSPKPGTLKKLYTFCPVDKADEIRNAVFSAGAGEIGEYIECSYNTEGFGTFKGMEGADPYVGKKGEQAREPEIRLESIFSAHLESKVISKLKEAHPYDEVAYDIISLDNPDPTVGAGMIGELEKEVNTMIFLEELKKVMETACIRYTPQVKKNIIKVAVCGGSGSFLLNEAIQAGADILVTADFKYHQFFDAEGKIVIADIGHYESEQFTMELLHELLTKNFNKFAVRLTTINTNPVKYLV
ncbi:MAG: Nif3-like dinuclear metal center hexameric protein [Bacteroidetes bacterium]|nr:Nif3-like dinuclear metal center hexameric protein [Bacteroidota bacterium]